MSLDQDFKDRIASIKARFTEVLDERTQEFEQLRHRIEYGQDAENALYDLRAGVHKLRGAAPTLGFARIGELAGESEDCINSLFDPKKTSDAASQFFGNLESLLTEMRSAASSSPG